jgi:predicted dehydrogenase
VNPPTVSIAVVGLGYWGPNLARNLDAIPRCELTWCCDGRPTVRERFEPPFPRARFTGGFEDLLADPALDAVVVTTPVPSHADLATRVLEADKHCLPRSRSR